ncbi:hypothetical protein [Bradyrhizobium lablabi]|uniref:hypothetical protein n=1 Tax=Bradyrhizobium lablabi TaxID=722472 RepID=UPI001BAAB1CA|nr:hypothetical protein [Bradyrhizobium lablabi]MBR0696052.1 hypothetical protein [Bradyrhizobium lablabi]
MSYRSAKFTAVLVAGILAGPNFTALAENNSNAADTCLSGPKGSAPAGSHWRYKLDRATKKQCWYLGEEKNKAAKTAPAQQEASPARDTTVADATPPQPQPSPQPQPAMRKSVADARAELTSAPTNVTPVATADAGQTSGATPGDSGPVAAADTNTNTPPSAVSTRWPDAASTDRVSTTQPAAAAPPEAAQTDVTPAQASTAPPSPPVAAEAPAEKSSTSTQMLLIVMIGALALAALVSALVFRLTRTRTPPYDISDEWRAPWDSIHTERAPPISPNRGRPLRLSESPPRRAQPPMPRREAGRDLDQIERDNRQIAEMLQRLARSATN